MKTFIIITTFIKIKVELTDDCYENWLMQYQFIICFEADHRNVPTAPRNVEVARVVRPGDADRPTTEMCRPRARRPTAKTTYDKQNEDDKKETNKDDITNQES